MLEISLLGRFEIRLEGRPVDLPSRPAQSLLAFLLLSPGTAHRREMLAGLLWPDASEANARAYLRQALWRVRKVLAAGSREYILADDLTVAFDAGADFRLDCAELQREVAPDAPADEIMRCVSVYHGDLLPGFYGEWAAAEREHLQAVFENRMGQLLDRLVAEQQWPRVLEWGERWIALGHAPEPAYRALMTAHHGLGDRSAVAAVYQRCVEALRRDLDVEPSDSTRVLYVRLSKNGSAGERAPGGLLVERRRHFATVLQSDLPRQLTSFIGRERETAQVRRLIASSPSRLVTLTGVGGCGKTRLALQVCHAVLADYPQGVWFVELAPLADPALVAKTLAVTLGLLEESGRPILATLIDSLRPKRCLLILDNCEHLVAASAQVAETLLRACPQLHILASSREALGVAGETVFRVPSLSVPDPRQAVSAEAALQYEAVRLFAERAATVTPGFAVTDGNAAAIVEICSRLDGIPLAIELAAARVKLLHPEQIAARLSDRFRLLTGGSRTALPRQQTLRATMDWSYNLLSEAELAVFCRLSVFACGWTLEAAEAVCDDAGPSFDVLDVLSQLEAKSLLVADQERGAEARYRLLETIRQYAREKLLETGEGEAVRDRHLAYFVAQAERAEPELAGPDQVAWLIRLELDLDNTRAALEWALERDVDAGVRLAAALGRFWDAHGHCREGADWLAQLLQRPADAAHPRVRAMALAVRSALRVTLGEFDESRSDAEAALEMFRAEGDQRGEALCQLVLGQGLFMQGDLASAGPVLEESLALYRSAGDKLGQADALSWLGITRRDPERAYAVLEESLAVCRELGHVAGIAGILVSLAQWKCWEGDYTSPAQWLDEAMELQHQLGSKSGMAWVRENSGYLAFRRGEYDRARADYEECIALNEEAGLRFPNLWVRVKLAHIALRRGDAAARGMLKESAQSFIEAGIDIGVVYALEGLATLAAEEGRSRQAALLLGWADAMRQIIGDARPPVEQADLDSDLAPARAGLGDAAFAAAYAEGRALTMEQAIQEA